MTIKELFDKAENGTLTYDEFQTLAGKAKFADLSEGAYVSKQKFDDELASRDTRISDLDSTIKQRDTDLEGLKAKLTSAGTDAEKLTQVTSDLASLQSKYDADIQAYKDQMSKQAYEFAVKDFAATQKFSSQAAKRDFISSMMAKNLQLDNGVIMGATDFVQSYAADNKDAFMVEKPANTPAEPKPQFAQGTNPQQAGNNDVSPFAFNFAGVRPHDNK